jgi:hypothetical protein
VEPPPIIAVLDPTLIRRERLYVPLWVSITGRVLLTLLRVTLTVTTALLRYWRLAVPTAAATLTLILQPGSCCWLAAAC